MKYSISKCVLIVCLFFASVGSNIYAQSTIISGTVIDAEDKSTLPGVTIQIKGTQNGTITDTDGKYSLEINTNNVLIFSFVGYETVEQEIAGMTVFDIELKQSISILGEIIITGYTSEQKGKITGAVTTIDAELLSALPLPSIDQALQGRAAGVSVTQNTGAPGEGVSVRIRGAGSINSGNSPLYIVDGIPSLDITALSSQDIKSITVLKDAGATTIYGSRAANGVVIVTTKTGSADQAKIEFNSTFGLQSASRTVEMTNRDDYITIYNEAATNDNVGKSPLFQRALISDAYRATLPDIDYVDAMYRDGILQSHSLSFSGGGDKTSYFISGNYYDNKGIIKSSDYNRLSSRINISSQVKTWLKTGVNLNISKAKTNLIGSSGDGAGGNGGSVIRYAFFRTPAIPIYDANGDFTDKPDRVDAFGDGYSPIGLLAYAENEKISTRLFGKYFLELSPFEGFTFTTNIGVNLLNENQRRFNRTWGTDNRINATNSLSVDDYKSETFTISNFANYTKSFNQHGYTVLIGTEYIKSPSSTHNSSVKNITDQITDLISLSNGTSQQQVSESFESNSLLSYFLKINYDYNEKYLLTGTIRRDGSSRFGKDNRWGNFYAGSLGWRLDKEMFLVNSDLIDRLMLRVGYGAIGNQEISNYPWSDNISPGYNYPFGGTTQVGSTITSFGNNAVQWETSKQTNVGVDLELLKGNLSTSIDYFNKITTDLLVTQTLPSSAGNANPPWVNNGEVLNRGFEIMLNYHNTIGNINYDISGNVATLHNEIISLESTITNGSIGSTDIIKTEVGYELGSFYLYEMEGIFQDQTDIITHANQGSSDPNNSSRIQPGDVKYKDQNKDGIIDEKDRTHLGSAIPKVTAGLNIGLNYKNIDVSIFFQGAYGQKIFSVLNRDIEGFYRPFNVTQRYFDNRWTGAGTTNEYPRASWDASGNNARIASSRFLENGSYTRLKNIRIGYKLPVTTVEKFGFSSIRIYISATNLFTWSKYSGMDPEMTVSDNAKGSGDGAAGMDWGTYPMSKSYNIGLTLTF